MGIVPDKFIHLDNSDPYIIEGIKTNMITSAGMGHEIPEKELIRVSAHTLKTYRQNQKEVNTTFGTHIYFYSCEGKVAQDVTNDLARMLRVRFRQNAPRRPPKVILVGPPGSGRTTQAQMIAS